MGLHKNETNLTTGDVHGAQPDATKFKTKRIGNDPLNPTYNLSKVAVRPTTPPRFIRDAMGVTDIEGTRPKPNK